MSIPRNVRRVVLGECEWCSVVGSGGNERRVRESYAIRASAQARAGPCQQKPLIDDTRRHTTIPMTDYMQCRQPLQIMEMF